MWNVKKVRKGGLWIISGVTLAALFGVNLAQEQKWVNTIVVVAIVLLCIWLLAMPILDRIMRSKSPGNDVE